MADPVSIIFAGKAVIAAATDPQMRKKAGVLIAAILTPFILIIVVITSLLSATADHNNAAVRLSFGDSILSGQMPEDYRQYIEDMRKSFSKLDASTAEITLMIEESCLDPVQVKAVFYSLYFGTDSLDRVDYRAFADCFVRYEERTRTRLSEDGTEQEETYTAAIALTSLPEIYARLGIALGRKIPYENQANASEVYYREMYGTRAPGEGDGFDLWSDWQPEQLSGLTHDLPVGESGAEAVRLALSRLGDPYSQELRGHGNYTDCSYLVQWVYRQLGVALPGTAAEQGRYCASKGLTVSKADLAPGDLVFWSHKANGRYLNITHVGVYAGGGKVVDASSSRGHVVYRNLFDADKQVLYARPYVETMGKASLSGMDSL